MSICYVSPRFYPVIGGVEIYLKDIAEYCSSSFKTFVVTSNLKNFPRNLLEKPIFIKKTYDLLLNDIEIIRAHTLKNILLKSLFYFNQFLNKKIELIYDKKINPNLYYKKKKNKINSTLERIFTNSLIYQRILANPNFSQIYFILKKIHKLHNIKIIHSTPLRFSSDIAAYLFSKRNKIPLIYTPLYHINPYADYILYPSFQYILKNSDAIIACTDLEKDLYLRYGINDEKVHVIPPGIEPNNYKTSINKNFRIKYNIPESAPLLLFMGRKGYDKGAMNSIYSLKYLIREFKDIKLVVAGPLTREYSLFFKRVPSNLKSHIIDLGVVDSEMKAALFSECDIFLMPSLDDAFGIVYLEAWLFKKPVIGALGGSVEGLIDNNINGILVPFRNIKKLSEKIRYLLKNEDMRQELGKHGYNKLISNYILEITNKKMLELYEKFI